jgi:hypothetical protein
MAITKKDIEGLFPTFLDGKPCFKPEVHQVGSKQLFVATFPTYQLLISYYTIVGYRSEGAWLLTTAKYSTTTSKQLTQFSHRKTIDWIEQEHLEELIEAAQCN